MPQDGERLTFPAMVASPRNFAAFSGVLLLLLVPMSFTSCSRSPGPRLADFKSDGCSLGPDRSLLSGESWCGCCVAHDVAYWKGGSAAERKAADSVLSACVWKHTGDTAFAALVYAVVRGGGWEYFPNWYRWGYGWPYGAKVTDSVRRAEVARKGPVDFPAAARRACGYGPD